MKKIAEVVFDDSNNVYCDTISFKIITEHGIHGRPATQIISCIKEYEEDDGVEFTVIANGNTFKTPRIGMMALLGSNIEQGDVIRFDVVNEDEEVVSSAIMGLRQMFKLNNIGEEV